MINVKYLQILVILTMISALLDTVHPKLHSCFSNLLLSERSDSLHLCEQWTLK